MISPVSSAYVLAISIALWSVSGEAESGSVAPQTQTSGLISVATVPPPGSLFLGLGGRTLFSQYGDDGVPGPKVLDSLDVEQTHHGIDASGSSGRLQFRARVMAKTEALRFGTSAVAKVTDPLVNPVNSNIAVDPDGVPNAFAATAFAYLADHVLIDAPEAVTHVRLHVSVGGEIQVSDIPSGFSFVAAKLGQTVGDWPAGPSAELFRADEGGCYALDLWTHPVPVVNGRFAFGLLMSSEVYTVASLPGDESLDPFFTVDFLDGVTINYVQGFDSRGEPVTLSSATGAFGTRYPTAPVPEPGTLTSILVGLGLVGAVFRRRVPARDITASRR